MCEIIKAVWTSFTWVWVLLVQRRSKPQLQLFLDFHPFQYWITCCIQNVLCLCELVCPCQTCPCCEEEEVLSHKGCFNTQISEKKLLLPVCRFDVICSSLQYGIFAQWSMENLFSENWEQRITENSCLCWTHTLTSHPLDMPTYEL